MALTVVFTVLDKTLILFIVAEFLHTVRITIQNRGRVDAEPFLVVGMIAGVRRVLVVTAVLGTTFLGNVYEANNTVPNVLFELFAAGTLHAVLVPTFVAVRLRAGRALSRDCPAEC